MPVFELLQQAADANLEEFIKIAGRNGEKFHALEQRIANIASLFEHPPIELEPRGLAVEKSGAVVRNLSNHIVKVERFAAVRRQLGAATYPKPVYQRGCRLASWRDREGGDLGHFRVEGFSLRCASRCICSLSIHFDLIL